MKIAIASLSSVLLSGCAVLHDDPCVNIKTGKLTDAKEVRYGWTKAELEAMPSWCGGSKRTTIYDRSGRVVGYIR